MASLPSDHQRQPNSGNFLSCFSLSLTISFVFSCFVADAWRTILWNIRHKRRSLDWPFSFLHILAANKSVFQIFHLFIKLYKDFMCKLGLHTKSLSSFKTRMKI